MSTRLPEGFLEFLANRFGERRFTVAFAPNISDDVVGANQKLSAPRGFSDPNRQDVFLQSANIAFAVELDSFLFRTLLGRLLLFGRAFTLGLLLLRFDCGFRGD